MKEEWINICNNRYAVSSFGKVKSLNQRSVILKGQRDKSGYWKVWLYPNRKSRAGKPKLVHRLVAEEFIPNYHKKPFVNHIDGNKNNNSITNLEWVTQSENELHAFRTGLKVPARGFQLPQTKLSNNDKMNIIKSKGINQYALAKKFNVTQSTISRIQRLLI